MYVRYGLSSRTDGTMFVDRGFIPDAVRNREQFLARCGISPQRVVSTLPEHGFRVGVVTTAEAGAVVSGDGLVTTTPDLYLALTVADCFPVWAWDEERRVVGIAHAGWRGVVAGIVPNFIATLCKAGALVPSLQVAIGPGIRDCHFEVQADVRAQFEASPGTVIERDGKMFIRLPQAIHDQLCHLGVGEHNIKISNDCTSCLTQKYFSHRRDRTEPLEAMLAYIGVSGAA